MINKETRCVQKGCFRMSEEAKKAKAAEAQAPREEPAEKPGAEEKAAKPKI